MKKLWRRILLLSALFVLAMSVHALADTTYYARTVEIGPSNRNAWTNQFTLSSTTNISVGINMYNNYTPNFSTLANQINNRITYVLEEVNTRKMYYLTDKNYNSVNYEVHMTVPAGTYSFGVNYSGIYRFMLYFRVTGSSGINIPDKYEIAVGQRVTIPITQQNTYGGYIQISTATSSNTKIAVVEDIDDDVTPNTITVYGKKKGTCYITVKGVDGSSDKMELKVSGNSTAPTLMYYNLNLAGGETVYNEVLNAAAGAAVTWKSSKTSVAKVNSKGKITAVSSGKATISATTVKNNQTYVLACSVTVKSSDPDFFSRIVSLNPSKKTVKINIRNNSGVNMIVYSADAWLQKLPDYYSIRSLKLKKTKYTIADGASKNLTFTINGSKVSGSKANYAVLYKFKVDGRVYFARVTVDEIAGQYILKSNLATDNWMSTYGDDDD